MSNEFESLALVFWGVLAYLAYETLSIAPISFNNTMYIFSNSIPIILFVSFNIAWWVDG